MHISEDKFTAKSPLIQRVRQRIRDLRMSPSTESAYVGWTVKFIFHFGIKNPADMGGKEVTEYLSWLATEKRVSASTQNQAFNALLFLYHRVLEKPLENIKAERARTEPKLPVWLTKDECVRLFAAMTGENTLAAMLAYGTGLRLMECLRLRVKDVDFAHRAIVVRQGKGEGCSHTGRIGGVGRVGAGQLGLVTLAVGTTPAQRDGAFGGAGAARLQAVVAAAGDGGIGPLCAGQSTAATVTVIVTPRYITRHDAVYRVERELQGGGAGVDGQHAEVWGERHEGAQDDRQAARQGRCVSCQCAR